MNGRPCMKKGLNPTVLIAAAMLQVFPGCGRRIDYDLPKNPIEFHTGTFVNPTDSEDSYQSIEYDGRTYIGYGTFKKSVDGNDVGKCLGYIVQDGVVMKDVRIFLLNADPDANYLIQLAAGGIMNQPTCLRALDTRGKKIGTPQYIESLDYAYWK